ncbi:Hypothetical predicted protein [Paramuricea clavata]|uniref:Uncharacterized protein n=1 Tax=Paramuricea clavata TaxID=317549 RepID=A0A7D9JU82_PARCT|nr:Hypothetical predicted protein [Paramuricea clavata]
MGDELTQLPNLPNRPILGEDIAAHFAAVNGHGDVIVENSPDTIKIIPKTGKSKVVKLPEPSEGRVIKQYIRGLAVDKNNNVYVVSWLKTSTEIGEVKRYVLDVLDENYNVKQDSRRLEYLDATDYVTIAVTKNNDIVVIQYSDPQVFVIDNTGKLKHVFELGSRFLYGLGICGQDDIMIPSDDFQIVEIYSEEGNLKSTIKLPEGHEVRGLAFNYVICKIIVLTYVGKKNSFFLLCYTEAGELETETFFCRGYDVFPPRICSHPSGPIVIVSEKSITFI